MASESMHGIQNPSEVRVDTQPRREREQLPVRRRPPMPPSFEDLLALGLGTACFFTAIAAVGAIIYATMVLVRTRR